MNLNTFRKSVKNNTSKTTNWRKFKNHKIGFISFLFVIFLSIISIFGYFIAPDNTLYSNRQILEISLSKPFTKIKFLKVKNDNKTIKQNFFEILLKGKKENFEYFPYTDYYFSQDSIYINEFKSELISYYKPFNIFDIFKNEHKTLPIDQMRTRVEKELLIEKNFYLGTDRYGRDVLSQLIIGSRVSLSVGFISVSIALIFGIFLGSIAGYFRGWIDEIIMWFINVIWTIPSLLLVIAISFALGKGFWQVFIAIGLTMWVDVARVVRGQVMSIREKEYIEAGRALGFSSFRIMFKHILPNIMGVVFVIAASNFASAILIESGLSFLGLGVQPPMPSWGTMIKENYGYIILDYAYLAIIPGIAISLLVLAFMNLGNALRDVLDVRN